MPSRRTCRSFGSQSSTGLTVCCTKLESLSNVSRIMQTLVFINSQTNYFCRNQTKAYSTSLNKHNPTKSKRTKANWTKLDNPNQTKHPKVLRNTFTDPYLHHCACAYAWAQRPGRRGREGSPQGGPGRASQQIKCRATQFWSDCPTL